MVSPQRSSAGATIALLFACGQLGCAATPKLARMNPYVPIETENGYRQNGQPLDPKSMRDELAKEPESASHVSRAQALGTVATILAAAGGALAGWPLGEYGAGEPHPNWELAYVGSAAIVVSIPLVLWSVGSMNSAVRAHNRGLGADPTKEQP